MPSELKTRKKLKKFKLVTFDKEVLKLVYSGITNEEHVQERTRVDDAQFKSRIEELIKQGFIVRGAEKLKLGIEGFNALVDKVHLKTMQFPNSNGELKGKIEEEIEEEVEEENEKLKKQVNKRSESEVELPKGQEKITELVDIEGKIGRMDLEEVIKKYGPTPEQKTRYLKKTEKNAVPKQHLATSQVSASDLCELCKAPFVLKISSEGHSKYGHCFCGAAYHKDCYDTILDDSRMCIRCGKKLMLLLDKNSRETLNELRDAFE